MAKYTLKGDNLSRFFTLCTDYKRMSGAVVRFYAETDSDGRKLNELIKNVYRDKYNYTNYGFLSIGDYKDFNVVFKSAADAKSVYDDIDGAMQEYASTGAAYSGNSGSGDSDDDESKTSDTTTYIIVGAVALLLVVLLLTRPKK